MNPSSFVRTNLPPLFLCTAGSLGIWGATLAQAQQQASAVRVVSAGSRHTCVIDTDGSAFCWGDNHAGQLGIGSNVTARIPQPVAGGLRFLDISAGGSFTCGIASDSLAYCWGYNSVGQLGRPPASEGCGSGGPPTSDCYSARPQRVEGARPFLTISAGNSHACGVVAGGQAYCWGQAADGTTTLPTLVSNTLRFKTVAAGDRGYSCGLTGQGALYCWGRQTSSPEPLGGAMRFSDLSVGGAHGCAVSTSAVALCWGDNDNLMPVSGGHRYRSVRASMAHSCGITATGGVFCWGLNEQGQLGNGTTNSGTVICDHPAGRCYPFPVPVQSGGVQFSILALGGFHSCGLTARGALYCWGNGAALGVYLEHGAETSPVPIRVRVERSESPAQPEPATGGSPIQTAPAGPPYSREVIAYVATMRSDLRNLFTAQRTFMARNDTFARSLGSLGTTFAPSAGVEVTIVEASRTGWSATTRHTGTTRTCGIFVGSGRPPLAGAEESEPKCTP